MLPPQDAAGNELPREKGLPEPPPGAKSDDVLLQVAFSSTQEAAMRAALLLGLTYDPKYGFGAALVPLSGTNIARAMPTPAESRAMSPSSEMAMHRWGLAGLWLVLLSRVICEGCLGIEVGQGLSSQAFCTYTFF